MSSHKATHEEAVFRNEPDIKSQAAASQGIN
jgi:hypothetical protein